MAITIMGASVTQFPQSANPNLKRAKLDALFTHKDVDTPKIVRKSIGRTSEAPFGKEQPPINVEYCEKVINTGALVSGAEYEVKVAFNDDEMEMEIIELIPCDPKVADHFNKCMNPK